MISKLFRKLSIIFVILFIVVIIEVVYYLSLTVKNTNKQIPKAKIKIVPSIYPTPQKIIQTHWTYAGRLILFEKLINNDHGYLYRIKILQNNGKTEIFQFDAFDMTKLMVLKVDPKTKLENNIGFFDLRLDDKIETTIYTSYEDVKKIIPDKIIIKML